MYAETELMFPYFPQGVHLFDEFCYTQKPNASLALQGNLVQTSTISYYNLGGEGDLFKAPEPVIQEQFMEIDPLAAAISMISCGENLQDFESSISSGQILSEVFYECRKDLLAKEGTEMQVSEVFGVEMPDVKKDQFSIFDGQIQKSVSLSCLRSTDYVPELRRSLSEGDIKTLGTGNINIVQSQVGLPKIMNSCPSKDRQEKLSRYWNKKSKRNFARKIKYACRKALADSQPRIRGRFAKTEDSEVSEKH